MDSRFHRNTDFVARVVTYSEVLWVKMVLRERFYYKRQRARYVILFRT